MIKDIIHGVAAYFTSFGLVTKLKLWRYFIIPILISLVVGIAIVSLGYTFSDDLGRLIAKIWIWNLGKETFTSIGSFVGGVFVIAFGFVLYKHIVMALVSPFMSPVSEKIEHYYLNKHNLKQDQVLYRKTSFNQQLVRGLRINLRNLLKELVITIALIICGFIPIVNLITTPLLFLVQSFYAGFGNIDYTLERYFNYKESIVFVKKNRGLAVGNGVVFMLLLLIPVVGFIIVLPLSVTASSIRTLERIYLNERKN